MMSKVCNENDSSMVANTKKGLRLRSRLLEDLVKNQSLRHYDLIVPMISFQRDGRLEHIQVEQYTTIIRNLVKGHG